MKRLALFLFPVLLYGESSAQYEEFTVHNSGFIYSDTTMDQLKFIVDSLNLKFKNCDLFKTYYSKVQGRAHYISMREQDVIGAKRDLESNISWNDFLQKYPETRIDSNQLVVKWRYINYYDEDVIEFSTVPLNGGYGNELQMMYDADIDDNDVQGQWIFKYYEADKYSKESIRGFYFTEPLDKDILPEAYARMVQYSDCMIDTNAQIFTDNAERIRWATASEGTKVAAFLNYVHRITDRPVYKEKGSESYYEEWNSWNANRLAIIDSVLEGNDKFKRLLENAVKEAVEVGGSDDEFEEYVGRYYSKEVELQLKRNRIVVGGCSMDNSPRIHAMSIAVLSAETVKWEIFLRAHLDIMNDRFERVSDGSWAWEGRQTYIAELEELDINVIDLLLGISLRIENPSSNHYFGSIGRLGRALSESKDASAIEAKMLNMIKDDQLDDYNRMLIYFLFLNYNYHVEDEIKKAANKELVKAAVATLPAYLRDQMKSED